MIRNVATNPLTGNVRLTVASPIGGVHVVDFAMTEKDFRRAYADWRGGSLVQNAYPTLNADEREYLMTGFSPVEWNAMFASGPCEACASGNACGNCGG